MFYHVTKFCLSWMSHSCTMALIQQIPNLYMGVGSGVRFGGWDRVKGSVPTLGFAHVSFS